MDSLRKETPPDNIPDYDKAYWYAKTPEERLAAVLDLNRPPSAQAEPETNLTVHKFQTADEWQAFKEECRQKQGLQ